MSFILKQTPRALSSKAFFWGIIQRKSIILTCFNTGIGERSFSSHLDEHFTKHLKQAFDQADKDKDGKLSAEEMEELIKMFLKGFGLEMFKEKFSQIDSDKDGKLNKEEISNLLDHLHPLAKKDQLDLIMSTYDKDQDGKVSVEELTEFAEKELLALKP